MKGETVEDGEEAQITRGKLASPAQATKWPARALAGQPGETLRNNLKWVRCPISVVTRRERPTMVKKRTVHSWTSRHGLLSMNQAFKAGKQGRFARRQGMGFRRGYADSWHRPSNRSLSRRPLCAYQSANAIAASCGGGAQRSILCESKDLSLLAAPAASRRRMKQQQVQEARPPGRCGDLEKSTGTHHARGHAGRQQEARPDCQGGGVAPGSRAYTVSSACSRWKSNASFETDMATRVERFLVRGNFYGVARERPSRRKKMGN